MKNLLITLMFVFTWAPALDAQCVDCPACGTEMAVGFLKKTSNSKTVYEVKQKEIAVPNICLPCKFNLRQQLRNLTASKCCPGKPCGGGCGCETGDCPKRVREGEIKVVKVMSKKKVKCDACAYEWEVADIEDVNEYLYDIEPASETKAATEATSAAPAIEADSAPVEVKEAPLMEVPAAPKMGWQDRPLFQLKKKAQPITFAPQRVMNTPPAAISSQPLLITAHPSAITTTPTAFNPPPTPIATQPATIVSQPTTIKALPASTSSSFLIRRPGPQN